MSSDDSYPAGIPSRPKRPRSDDGAASTIALALLGLVMTSNPIGLLAGGAIGNSLGSQPLPLEAALRSYFTKQGIPLIAFYRLGPNAAQILFQYREQYWTVLSRAPANPNWTLEELDDWLYGDIVGLQLPTKLSEIATLP